MKSWGILILSSLFGSHTTYALQSTMPLDLSIVDVRRNITLADEDVVYKDFYINGGEADGLKKNLVITAVRKIQIRDANGSQSFGEIKIPVGQLRVIAIYDRVSVAREYKLLSRDELPMLEQIGLMNGDKIDLKGAFIDNNRPVYKKKTAEHPVKKETTVVAVVAAPIVVGASAPAAPSNPTAVPSAKASQGPAPASVAPGSAPKLEKAAETAVSKIQ